MWYRFGVTMDIFTSLRMVYLSETLNVNVDKLGEKLQQLVVRRSVPFKSGRRVIYFLNLQLSDSKSNWSPNSVNFCQFDFVDIDLFETLDILCLLVEFSHSGRNRHCHPDDNDQEGEIGSEVHDCGDDRWDYRVGQ